MVEYFNELLNGNDTVTSPDLPIFHSQASGDAVHGTEAPPSYQEVTLTIRRLKNNKSPGSDGIPAEFLKAGGDVLASICIQFYRKSGLKNICLRNGI